MFWFVVLQKLSLIRDCVVYETSQGKGRGIWNTMLSCLIFWNHEDLQGSLFYNLLLCWWFHIFLPGLRKSWLVSVCQWTLIGSFLISFWITFNTRFGKCSMLLIKEVDMLFSPPLDSLVLDREALVKHVMTPLWMLKRHNLSQPTILAT